MRSLELKVGALLLGAIALLVAFVVALGNVSFAKGFRVTVDFNFSGNLHAGAPVKLSGIKVGKVEEVRFLGGELDPTTGKRVYVRAIAWLEERVRQPLRSNAEFFVSTQGVLGEQYLEVQPGTFDRPPLDITKPVAGVDPPRTDLIVARLYEFLDSVTSLLHDDKTLVRDLLKSSASAVRTIDELLQANKSEINRLVGHVDELTKRAGDLLGSVQKGIGDPQRLSATLANVEQLTAAVRRDVEPLLQRLKKALDGVNDLAGAVGPAERKKIGQAIDDLSSIAKKADAVAADAQSLVAQVKAGKGTAGALVVDPQIYDDLKELVRDLKRNPWKFFWKE